MKTSNVQPKCQGPLQLLSSHFLMTSTAKQMRPNEKGGVNFYFQNLLKTAADCCRTERHIQRRDSPCHVTRKPLPRSTGQDHQAALVGCTGRPTWTYSNGDQFICKHDVYRVTTCRPGRRHIVAAARLQLVNFYFQNLLKTAADCCRTKRHIQRDTWGSVHTGRVVQQCLHANCL